DDLGWPDVSTYGLKRVATPNIDRLATSGVAFTDGYVAASVCAVSRAGLLTGRQPQAFGFDYNLDDSANMADGLPTSEQTIADRMKALGYRTSAIGKWHQGEADAFYPTRRGFDRFWGFLAGETVYVDPKTPGIVTTKTKVDRPIDKRKPTGEIVEGPDRTVVHNFGKYLTDEITDQALDTIHAAKGQTAPFFLYLAYNAPHWPLQAPQAEYDKFPQIKNPVRRTYVAMIASLDDNIGRVLDELERTGQRDNTLIVFLSDNGCPIQFGFCDCSHPLAAGKFTYLEGGTRVPFMMSWPAGLKPHAPVDTPVSSLDIVPTLLRAAAPSKPLPKGLDGRDLLDIVRRPRPELARRTLYWGQAPVFAVVQGRWKLWKSLDRKTVSLFDLQADPAEEHNVADANPKVRTTLEAKLDAWRARQPPPAWPIHNSGSVDICGRETERVY
ncbi:MAG: sulfatase-like hydrolase/transferase, partial [Proteobacteria bacterium]|nr:sulfatase-like hydrolase/transferase [Pseudomonadota bacterium]